MVCRRRSSSRGAPRRRRRWVGRPCLEGEDRHQHQPAGHAEAILFQEDHHRLRPAGHAEAIPSEDRHRHRLLEGPAMEDRHHRRLLEGPAMGNRRPFRVQPSPSPAWEATVRPVRAASRCKRQSASRAAVHHACFHKVVHQAQR